MILLAVIVLGVSMLVISTQLSRASGLMGDANGDGKVDGKDIAIVAQAFGSYPEHARWNSAADMNGDNIVDSLDLALVAVNFGKST
jgi:hypothetical protein